MKKIIVIALLAFSMNQANAQNQTTQTNEQALKAREAYLNSEEYKHPKVVVLNPVETKKENQTAHINENGNGAASNASHSTQPVVNNKAGEAQLKIVKEAEAKSKASQADLNERIKAANSSGVYENRK
jgi:hypothetical protein